MAFIIGAIIAAALPPPLRATFRLLVGWNIAAWGYVLLIAWPMATSSPEQVEGVAQRENTGALGVLSIMSVASALSIVVIVLELATVKQVSGALRVEHFLLTGLTVIGSWLLVIAIYTSHYAYSYYRSPPDRRALRFPEDEPDPSFWDFMYFALTIAVAAQTSDVSVASRSMRKAVMAQSLLSFFFNVVIIGLTINVSASLLG